ncbi:MAG: hypothetical protein M1816_002561 [Peltula sp. TS41687]|nr:MAG: hypothetical protein M1816_002561 [Peltula sp. TS41687]
MANPLAGRYLDPFGESYCTKTGEPKPPLPYFPGQYILIRPHESPLPIHSSCSLTPVSALERQQLHPLERCLLHPPLPGSIGSGTIQLRILQSVRVGDGHNAQLMRVQAAGSREDSNTPYFLPSGVDLMAKFYDPLYCDHEQDDVDPFVSTDYHYTHETAVYKALSPVQGEFVPRYHGSYSCDFPIPGRPDKRSVRLILMEAIPGTSMRELKPTDFSQPERQTIMKRIIEAESSLYTHNVLHRDLHPRNILVLDVGSSSSTLRVVLIDFGDAQLGRTGPKMNPSRAKRYLPSVPISPLLRWHQAWWDYRLHTFKDWIDWDWPTWLERQWPPIDAVITDEMRSIWLPAFLFDPPKPAP